MILKSGLYRVEEIVGKTKAKFYKDIAVDDIISCSLVVRDPGHGRTLYATYISVHNITQDTATSTTLTQLANVLKKFKLYYIG